MDLANPDFRDSLLMFLDPYDVSRLALCNKQLSDAYLSEAKNYGWFYMYECDYPFSQHIKSHEQTCNPSNIKAHMQPAAPKSAMNPPPLPDPPEMPVLANLRWISFIVRLIVRDASDEIRNGTNTPVASLRLSAHDAALLEWLLNAVRHVNLSNTPEHTAQEIRTFRAAFIRLYGFRAN